MKVDFGPARKRPSVGHYAMCKRCAQAIADLPEDTKIDPEMQTYCSVECMPASTMPVPKVRP